MLIEDDQSFGYILSEYLMMHDFEVHWAKSGEEGLEKLQNDVYKVAIVDIMLPGISGFETAVQIRESAEELPFIFLSAKSLKIDKLKGFKLGADDYVTKPIDEELLLAKINAIINRSAKSDEELKTIQLGIFAFDPKLQKLESSTELFQLTKTESDLLLLLATHQNKILPRKKALNQIWNATDEFSRKSMDVFISKLRKYISADPKLNIKNIHSQGFVLEVKS